MLHSIKGLSSNLPVSYIQCIVWFAELALLLTNLNLGLKMGFCRKDRAYKQRKLHLMVACHKLKQRNLPGDHK